MAIFISKEDRTLSYLKDTVKTVYKVLRKTEKYMAVQYDYSAGSEFSSTRIPMEESSSAISSTG